ncbi:uncharacterized protein LOC143720953 isoform X2 [Siphateles boraxobius]|uniref:uncharacterized protein LOC143720953 isoform X2 n=1 Tax=Siphateles boraxobius TaxID=180520 RepID=UPI0040636FA1
MSLHTGTFVRQFPESDTTGSMTGGAESSNGTATQIHSQSFEKPIGSAAARFKIRSAKTLKREPTTKDLRMISNIFEGGKVQDSSQKSDPGKDLNKVCTSSASCTHTENNDKKTSKNVGNGTHKDSALSINSEKGDVSAKQLNTQEEESQTASDSGRGNDLRRYQSNKSKSLDWRGTSRAGHGNRTGMTSRTTEFDNFITRSGSFERTGANNKITSKSQENQPSSVSWRIHAYNGDRKVYPNSGSTSVRMNRVNFALEQASSGQSLPVRLKPRLSQGSIEEGSSLWAQQQGESSLDQTDNRMGSCSREQGPSNTEEVTGNQTIMERIKKLFGTDAKSDAHSKNSIGLKRNNTLTSDESFPKSMDTVDSTPSHRKYTTDSVFGTSDFSDSQQGKHSYNVDKDRTLPRGFSKTYLCQKQEPSTNKENKNDQRDNSSGLSFSMSSKPTSSTEMSSFKKVQSLLPENNEETSRMCLTGSPKHCSQSLERTRSRLSATAPYNSRRNQSACSDSSSSISSQGVKPLLTNSEGIKGEIGKVKKSDKESPQRLDIYENKCLDGLQDGITQPKYLLASKGAAYNEIHKEEEKDVFTDKTEGRRGEGVLEKLHVASFESVKNTITMFESLAQQSKSTRETFLTRRTLSVQEHPKPVALVKKSDSDKNLHFKRFVGNTESLRTNLFNKSDSNDETEGTLDTSRTTHSNSIVKVRPTLQCQETYKKSVELAPAFKQMTESRTEQVINRRDDDEWTTVNKTHTDEPDSAITATSGLRNIRTLEEKAGIPSISQQSNVKSLSKQQTINIKIVDDDENTQTNSSDRPLTVSIQKQINPGAVTVNGNHPKALPNLSQSSTPVQTIYSSLNNSNNNNHETTRKDCTILTTSKARWSSDEEDDDEEETEEDSDSGESSVTITSNMSQSERRSFSLSLVDLCNYGGVDYKPSDSSLSDNGEDLPSTRSASLSSDISAFSSVTLLSTDELDRLLDDVRGLGDDTLQKYEDVQVVVLHKEVGSGLGFTLAGGVDQNKPVTVHRVIPGGVAAHEGSIYEGARVLSINGTALQNSAHLEALRTLRKARGQGMAVVVLQSGNSRREATERQRITGG